MNPEPGVCCPHDKIVPASMQHPRYRESDGDWIYYHGHYHVGKGSDMRVEFCGKPELWRWRLYVRRCGECNIKFSNPWVPVCEGCWDSPSPYPSWAHVVQLDQQMKAGTTCPST